MKAEPGSDRWVAPAGLIDGFTLTRGSALADPASIRKARKGRINGYVDFTVRSTLTYARSIDFPARSKKKFWAENGSQPPSRLTEEYAPDGSRSFASDVSSR